MLRLIAVAVLLALPQPAKAHQSPSGWLYDSTCCSNRDCQQVPDTAVSYESTVDAYVVRATGERFYNPSVRIKGDAKHWIWSKDQFFHRCTVLDSTFGKTRCLYVPQPGF